MKKFREGSEVHGFGVSWKCNRGKLIINDNVMVNARRTVLQAGMDCDEQVMCHGIRRTWAARESPGGHALKSLQEKSLYK